MNPFQRSLFSAFAGLFGYGAWAYLVNSMHGSEAAIKAACVQGSYSFALTFVMTLMIEALYRTMVGLVGVNKTSQATTILLTCAALFSSSWWINAMANTPEIFSTVILGYVIGAIYSTSYVVGLAHGEHRDHRDHRKKAEVTALNRVDGP